MDQFKDDLKVLEIDQERSDSVTISEVKRAYRKKAFEVHPDTSGFESTSFFQTLSNAYERALEYLVSRHNDDEPHANDGDNTTEDVVNDEEKFIKENFDRFNFPKTNSDSFTVVVENILANTWQECFEKLFGKPIVNKNRSSGTESGRVWKIDTVHEEKRAELTIHFYNKPIKSKKSKFLIQGAYLCLMRCLKFTKWSVIQSQKCPLRILITLQHQ